MSRSFVALLVFVSACLGSERRIDFTSYKEGQTPTGFRSVVTGEGPPGNWRIVLDEPPSALPPLSSKAPIQTKQPVLAQLDRDATDERFPLFIFEEESYGDFRLVTQLKTVAGEKEQMAGIAFRLQDEKNYYVVRISSLGNTFRFYKFVNGVRSSPIGPEVPIPPGVWHELSIECQGNSIRCVLDGKEAIPPLTDNSFSVGKIGFWTKSDSVSYFGNTLIRFTPRERFAQALVRETMAKYPRLLGLKIFAVPKDETGPRIVASNFIQDLGEPGGKVESDCIARGGVYYGRGAESMLVTMPLHDKNGEKVAAVRIVMKTFKGQTEKNAVARALPVLKSMEGRVVSAKELLE